MSQVTLYKLDKLIHQLEKPTNKVGLTSDLDEAKTEKQSTSATCLSGSDKFDDITIGDIKAMIAKFATDRDWDQYHTPRNLLLALVGEIGELSEIFQWKGECKPGLPAFTLSEKVHLGEEMADCLIYLCRLADRCGVNLKHSVLDKMQKNNAKYPAHVVKGSSKKYTEYAANE